MTDFYNSLIIIFSHTQASYSSTLCESEQEGHFLWICDMPSGKNKFKETE